MNEIKIINKSTFLDKEIDVWGSVEQPLFRAKDVASWLLIKNVSDLVKRVDNDEVHRFNLGSLQGETWFLTEDGLYEVLMQSRKPIAKQFKKGVKAILHEIRNKGGYIASSVNDTPEAIMARALKIADETLKRNEQRVRELEAQTEQQAQTIGIQQKELTIAAPKVKYYDDTLASTDCLTTTQVADDLGISARALNQQLSNAGIQYFQSGSWHLKGKYREWQLASTRTYNYIKGDGTAGTKVNLVWNQRGKRFILALYNNDFNVKDAIAEINGEKRAALVSKNNQSNF
jgi:prophage antirepressor-like protein